jgi:predicted RNase H-like HicB family nuclease
MAKGRILYSILKKDDKNYVVSIGDWGNMTLQGEELSKFRADIQQLLLFYDDAKKNGLLKISTITETVTTQTGDTISVIVGHEFESFDNYEISPIQTDLFQQMSNDPNIVKFNYIEYIETNT